MHTVLELFSGAVGGWSIGLERAGYTTVAACEINPWRRAVFAAQHPGCVMYGDVRDLTAERLRGDLGYLPDIIVGSPPCQQISAANCKGTGITDDHLFWEWARLVFEVRPLWCAAENSPRARTEGIDGILDALDQAGYAAWPCVVGADNAGANHRRKRLWLIAADATRIGRHADDAHPDGWFAGGARRHADGCLGMGAGADGPNAGDADFITKPSDNTGVHQREETAAARVDLFDDAGDAAGIAGLRRRRVLGLQGGAEPAQADLQDFADADRPGHPFGLRLARNDGEELPAALRDIGASWPAWNGGLAGLAAACAAAGFGVLDDGPGRRFPAGLRNRAIAALGDAVVADIPEAIGRAMISMAAA
jgi:DNA (cytosine-5)-methyltransferase 1